MSRPDSKAGSIEAVRRQRPAEPFHDCSCEWAKKISERDLVGCDTREKALADNHRPCKVCSP